jgi:3-oxoacyl-[acyl-carrier-protein] synthase-1
VTRSPRAGRPWAGPGEARGSLPPGTNTPPACRLAALGMVNALGSSAAEIWPRVRAGHRSGLTRRADLVPGQVLHVAEVRGPLPDLPRPLARYASRNNALALAAVRQIEAPVRAAAARFGAARVGVVAGTSTSGVADAERAMREYLDRGRLPAGFDYAQLEHGSLAAFLAAYLEVTGPAYTLSTACSSGAKALASGRALLELGVCDAVVAGGADSLCGMTTNGFWGLQLVSADPSLPFSVNRRGLTIGEGAAFFLLSREPGGAELLGVGECSEGYDMSAPQPDGAGAEAAMRAALLDAGLPPDRVSYVGLHGTGTRLNDSMESKAVSRLFGEKTWCSTSKPLVGHTLGASAPVELGCVWLMLEAGREGVYPLIPHCWDERPDSELPPLRLVRPGDRLVTTGRPVVLLNSFGFGGSNCSLVIAGASRC